jgi:hypothetical protein
MYSLISPPRSGDIGGDRRKPSGIGQTTGTQEVSKIDDQPSVAWFVGPHVSLQRREGSMKIVIRRLEKIETTAACGSPWAC